jgi:hypothetical protein
MSFFVHVSYFKKFIWWFMTKKQYGHRKGHRQNEVNVFDIIVGILFVSYSSQYGSN